MLSRKSNLLFILPPPALSYSPFASSRPLHLPTLISISPHPFIFHAFTHSEETMCWWPSCREQQALVHHVCCVHRGLYTWWVLLYEAADTNSYLNELLSVSCYYLSHNSIKEKHWNISHYAEPKICEGFWLAEKFSCWLYVSVCLGTTQSARAHYISQNIILTSYSF